MNKNLKYWIPTGLLSLMMLGSAGMYIFNYDEVVKTFTNLGHPSYIVYPLAILKVLGVLALISNKSHLLSEWAYAGFFFNFVLALTAHLNLGDGQFAGSLLAIFLLLLSRTAWPLRNID